MEVPYTDVDYIVFSDCPSLVAWGESPYKRTIFLVPNSLPRSGGKFLFAAADLLVGFFIRAILKQSKVSEEICTYCVMVWLLNPFTFTIGTRGKCEPLVFAMILWIIICLMNGKLFQAAVWYGFIVHFRIYPIIYALAIVLVLDPQSFQDKKPLIQYWNPGEKQKPENGKQKFQRCGLWLALRSLITRERITFALISGGVFLSCTLLFYHLYGWEFLYEALFYHLTRTDPRHNFSIYFYHIYLHYEQEISVMQKLVSFLPQFMVQLVFIIRFARDLLVCLFLQTVAFVAFNKVITAQYFVWFFCLLPLILPWTRLKLKWEGLLLVLLWMGAQTHWLLWGYLLEFKGQNVFLQLWIASLLFFAANTFILIQIIRRHCFSSIFRCYDNLNTKNDVKHQ